MNESHRSRSWWGPWAFGTLALLATSCFYTFENPVEKEPPGSVAGTIALQGAVGNQTAAGGHVTIQWTNGLELSLDSSSKFLFQDLPDGTYSLEVNIPPAAMNDYPLVLLRPNLLLPNVGNMADSLDIGTLQVPASGTVGGTVSPPAAGIAVGCFAPPANGPIDAGLGVFEGFSTSTDSSGHYSFQLPAGLHVLAASDSADSTLAPATVLAAASQTLDLTMATVMFTGSISGQLVGSGYGASATGNVPWAGATFVATDSTGMLVNDGGLNPGTASQEVGSAFNVTVLGGRLVTLTMSLPPQASTNPCDTFGPLTLPAVPVIAGQSTSLGQVTWLNNTALGANGLGPCADGGTISHSDGGGDGGPVPMGWIDAGTIPWDAGDIAQIEVFPLTTSVGGTAVAWIAGQPGAYNLYSETLLNGVDTQTAITTNGFVFKGSLSGTQINGASGSGVLLTFSTISGPNATYCEFIPSDGSAPQGIAPSALPNVFGLGPQQTTTFVGTLHGTAGVFVFQTADPQISDAGIVGVFTEDGLTFTNAIGLQPGGAGPPISAITMIGTSCDVADLHGDAGFCLAGSGTIDIDGGTPTTVGFVSSFSTVGLNPVLSGTVLTSPPSQSQPIYVGFTSLPGKVAVAIGRYQDTSGVDYWELTDLTVASGPATSIAVATDLLLDYDGSVLGLSQPNNDRTDLQFLPNGAQPMPLVGFVNGSTVPSAYVDPLTNEIVTAGVPNSGPDAYSGAISILRLVPDGG